MSDTNGVARAANFTTIIVSSFATFAFCGAGAMALVTFKVAPLEAAQVIYGNQLAETRADLRKMIDREIERNDDISQRLSAQEKVTDLFVLGKLKLE